MIDIERDIDRLAQEMMADDDTLTDEAAHALARVVILDLLRLASERNSNGARKHFKAAPSA